MDEMRIRDMCGCVVWLLVFVARILMAVSRSVNTIFDSLTIVTRVVSS